MRYGTGHDSSYFDDNDDDIPVHHVATVPHNPAYDHVHDHIHRGAVHLIDAYHHHPGYEYVVLGARRILEHDAHNATVRREEYVDDLVRALARLADDT